MNQRTTNSTDNVLYGRTYTRYQVTPCEQDAEEKKNKKNK